MSPSQASVVVTGSSGFLGSAIVVELARRYRVLGIDQREPGAVLRQAAPSARFEIADIADRAALARIFSAEAQQSGGLNFVVHFAAFYHFDRDARPEYTTSNIHGTRNVVDLAAQLGAKRLVFASSLAALKIPQDGAVLTETSPIGGVIPYAWSKAEGEAIVASRTDALPAVSLRIGAVFSDWSELPFLWSLLKLWGGGGLTSRVVPGRGHTALPFIHRLDLARMVARVLESSDALGRAETFLACQHGSVSQNEIFTAIQALLSRSGRKPRYVPVWLARMGLRGQWALGAVTGNYPYERPWMLDYVDVPLIADTAYTRQKLGWDTAPEFGLLARLPFLFERFTQQRERWEQRNQRRTEGAYMMDSDD